MWRRSIALFAATALLIACGASAEPARPVAPADPPAVSRAAPEHEVEAPVGGSGAARIPVRDGHLLESEEPPLASESEPVAPPVDSGQAPAESPSDTVAMPDPCVSPPPPLPDGPARFASFREPLPRTPLWNPPGPKRVGLQAGHWLVHQTPPELSRLGGGAVGGGKEEWEVNLDIARRAQAYLQAAGLEVDVLPATIPPRYRAHVFVSIHADGDPAGRIRGFKVARPGFSSVPEADDRLVEALNGAYGAATALPRDDEHISLRMRYYYAFNSRRYCHAVAPGVPQAIVETGFLTSAADRALLLGNPDAAARGIANGVLAFLNESPLP